MVASKKAASLFMLYDVDADAPNYMRPPPSARSESSSNPGEALKCRAGSCPAPQDRRPRAMPACIGRVPRPEETARKRASTEASASRARQIAQQGAATVIGTLLRSASPQKGYRTTDIAPRTPPNRSLNSAGPSPCGSTPPLERSPCRPPGPTAIVVDRAKRAPSSWGEDFAGFGGPRITNHHTERPPSFEGPTPLSTFVGGTDEPEPPDSGDEHAGVNVAAELAQVSHSSSARVNNGDIAIYEV